MKPIIYKENLGKASEGVSFDKNFERNLNDKGIVSDFDGPKTD